FNFFDFTEKSLERVLPQDVIDWQNAMQDAGLSTGTIYNRISALANYYEYLKNEVGLANIIPINPAKVTIPRSPKPFESESVSALTREELFALLNVVENYANSKKPLHLRDYAILQLFVVTGKRREEILSLQGKSIQIKSGRFFVKTKVKGGYFVNFEMNDPIAQDSLLNYLEATGRSEEIFGKNEALWLRHSTGGKNLEKVKLTSHGFAKRMKKYALEAGISGFHIHRLRHTFAKIVSESVESMADTQEALGHSNIKTTQVYVKRLSVKKDKYSKTIREAMEQEKSKSA
ncbi:MAG TPA: tyrosine-type recombinase/integrase, partial [Pyrinomonadaceae bacterium]|nr:tyrosine-type recombinase/integrase [Pyrinomonadaceae bacterium]